MNFWMLLKKMNRKKLRLLSFLNFLLAVDSMQLIWIEKDRSYWVILNFLLAVDSTQPIWIISAFKKAVIEE